MPKLIAQVYDLSFRYPEQPEPLFQGVSFTLYQGGRSALLGAGGACLLVSHDRYLRERVASRFLELAGGNLEEVNAKER